jgi:DNA-binding IclR family transcriptional regulator
MTAKVKSSRYTVHVLAKALDLLDMLAQHGSLSLTELCQALGQPKSSVFRYLVTLEEHGYVRRSPNTEEYSLGIKLIKLGRAVTTQFTMHEAAVPFMRHLQDTFRETVNLAILEEGKVVYLEILEGTQSIRMAARPGQRDFAHSTAIGKAILAYSPDSEVEGVIKRYGLPALTNSTITSIERLQAELAQVREIGYAVDNIENEAGVRCVGAPVFNHEGSVVAGISISGPADRLSGSKIEMIGKELVLSARSISEHLGYHNLPPIRSRE